MNVVKMSAVKKESVESPLFTGADVSRQVLLPESREFNVNIVNFGKGVRNKFHTHDTEQVLIVIAGRGYIATEKEKKVITVGDVVLIDIPDFGDKTAGKALDLSQCGPVERFDAMWAMASSIVVLTLFFMIW